MDKDKKVGLAVNIIVTITLFIVCVYLGFHFYNTGMETGFRKGRVAGWNTGYREGQESMVELVSQYMKKNTVKTDARTPMADSPIDTSMIESQLDDIKRKIDNAEFERRMEGQ
jgi:hypothetical protein